MDAPVDKRDRILAAAARLIVENGLQCSMAAIAEEAGIATGSLYTYFDSKDALVRGVYGGACAELTAWMSQQPEAACSAGERVRRYIADYIDFIWMDPLRARLFDYLDNTPLISRAHALEIFAPFVDHAIQMMSEAQREGSVRDGMPRLHASFVRGAIRNALKRLHNHEQALTPALREQLIDMCWQAIAAR